MWCRWEHVAKETHSRSLANCTIGFWWFFLSTSERLICLANVISWSEHNRNTFEWGGQMQNIVEVFFFSIWNGWHQSVCFLEWQTLHHNVGEWQLCYNLFSFLLCQRIEHLHQQLIIAVITGGCCVIQPTNHLWCDGHERWKIRVNSQQSNRTLQTQTLSKGKINKSMNVLFVWNCLLKLTCENQQQWNIFSCDDSQCSTSDVSNVNNGHAFMKNAVAADLNCS